MRIQVLLFVALASWACKRENPAFLGERDDTSTTQASVSVTGTSSATASTGSSGDPSETSATTATTEASATGEPTSSTSQGTSTTQTTTGVSTSSGESTGSTSLATTGGGGDCLSGDECAKTEFCQFPEWDACGYQFTVGICAPRPTDCMAIYQPVQGCDCMTHANECEANKAGYDVACVGEEACC